MVHTLLHHAHLLFHKKKSCLKKQEITIVESLRQAFTRIKKGNVLVMECLPKRAIMTDQIVWIISYANSDLYALAPDLKPKPKEILIRQQPSLHHLHVMIKDVACYHMTNKQTKVYRHQFLIICIQ